LEGRFSLWVLILGFQIQIRENEPPHRRRGKGYGYVPIGGL